MTLEVEEILVVGAGAMGAGIAQVAASAGYTTRLFDIDSEQLDKAKGRIERDLERGVELGKVDEAVRDTCLAKLQYMSDLEATAPGADLVIEAIVEDLEQKVLGAVDALVGDAAILASNTSSLSITAMSTAVKRPSHVVGMHFFNPPPRMKLVEVIRGKQTADEVVATTMAVAKRMGKDPIEVAESPAFVASRLNAVLGNEAFKILAEGVASAEDIDRAAKLGLNHPMGPLELGDLVGWDVRVEVLKYMHAELGDAYEPCPLMVDYVAQGRLGKKVGRGVYEYPSDG